MLTEYSALENHIFPRSTETSAIRRECLFYSVHLIRLSFCYQRGSTTLSSLLDCSKENVNLRKFIHRAGYFHMVLTCVREMDRQRQRDKEADIER